MSVHSQMAQKMLTVEGSVSKSGDGGVPAKYQVPYLKKKIKIIHQKNQPNKILH